MIDQELSECSICLVLPATLKYLHIVSLCIEGMLSQEADLCEREVLSYDVQLAVQEICTNIVCHAYIPEQRDKLIRVKMTLHRQPKRLIVELFDTGIAFDQSKVKEPDLEEGQVHGYGLFLVKNLMDVFSYSRNAHGNHWHLAKNLEVQYEYHHN